MKNVDENWRYELKNCKAVEENESGWAFQAQNTTKEQRNTIGWFDGFLSHSSSRLVHQSLTSSPRIVVKLIDQAYKALPSTSSFITKVALFVGHVAPPRFETCQVLRLRCLYSRIAHSNHKENKQVHSNTATDWYLKQSAPFISSGYLQFFKSTSKLDSILSFFSLDGGKITFQEVVECAEGFVFAKVNSVYICSWYAPSRWQLEEFNRTYAR